jgi:thiol-disulfide isomerase/thioredoxin
MYKKLILPFILFLMFFLYALVERVSSQPLNIGDRLPEMMLSGLVNFPQQTASLSSFKAKLLIIDFWQTNCGTCVASISKLEALKKEFGDSIKFLMVTPEDERNVSEFLRKRSSFLHITNVIPGVTGDIILHELFPHLLEPHLIWIDEKSVVRYVTGSEEMVPDNIRKFFNNQDLQLREKTDSMLDIAYDQPLFTNPSVAGKFPLQYYSILGNYLPLKPGATLMADKSTIKVFNMPIKSMYQIAYDDCANNINGVIGIAPNRTFLEVPDTTKYVMEVNSRQVTANMYCYELVAPTTSRDTLRMLMREDLKRYFNLEARMEKRKITCLVISADDTTLLSANSTVKRFGKGYNMYSVDAPNEPFWEFIFGLAFDYLVRSPYPILDETGIKGKVNLHFDAKMDDWKSIATGLKKYSVKMRLEEREIPVLVIKEKTSSILNEVTN